MQTGVVSRFLTVIILTGALTLAHAADGQRTAGGPQGGKEPKPDADVLMKCFYEPAADEQSSSLPTYSIGFKFILLRNNNNEIAVDVYSLNDKHQPKKQIGHAELVGGVTDITETTKASQILSNLQLSESSPFDFAMTFGSTATDSSTGTRFTGVVEDLVLFTGETFTNLSVQCRIAPNQGNSQSGQAVLTAPSSSAQ